MNCTTVMLSSSHLLSTKDQCVSMYICNMYAIFINIPIQKAGILDIGLRTYEFELIINEIFPKKPHKQEGKKLVKATVLSLQIRKEVEYPLEE